MLTTADKVKVGAVVVAVPTLLALLPSLVRLALWLTT
jgi:hypothetical protein